jgi:transcription elongation factor Elf1
MYGAILSGAYTADATVEPFEFDGPCPVCGSDALVAEYADERARLSCPDCERWRNEFSVPPATVDQFALEDLPVAFDDWMRGTVAKVLRGFCTNCGGRVDGHLEWGEDLPRGDETDRDPTAVRAVFDCGRCGDELTSSPLLPTLFHPTAVAFFADHGVDVLGDPSWRYFGPGDDLAVEVVDEGPLRVRVSVTLDREELVATVGPDVAVESVSVGERGASRTVDTERGDRTHGAGD